MCIGSLKYWETNNRNNLPEIYVLNRIIFVNKIHTRQVNIILLEKPLNCSSIFT